MRLGDFELKQTIGSGGMGEIWHAEHGADRIPVAIKVIRSAASAEFREAFLHEVRLVAGLQHRNVILALDAGTVDAAAARESEGKLTAGAPYLAMELAGGGSLGQVRVRRWDELQHVLLELLQALAHAHARGVVHRDIKPANLLLAAERSEIASRPRDLRSARIVLTDFGISSSRHAAETFGEDAIGTPEFMAPEQVRGKWRDQGPWTDLYAVGVLAFRLATGRPPFKKANSTQTMLAHLREPVPPLEPIFDVPAGLEAFVRRLLAKDPDHRFAYAGDARRALQALDELDDGGGATRRMPALRDVPSLPATSDRARPVGVLDDADVPTEQNSVQAEISLITGGFGRPTGPATGKGAWSPRAWTETDRRDLRLVGAGLGLYGLRPVPLVDRVSERDRLWGALVQVRTTGRSRVVVLRGPSGTGKSRLASWLSQTAHEAGAGLTLEATLRTAGPDLLARLAIGALRCDGLAGVELRERVAEVIGAGPHEPAVETLARIAAPHATDAAPLTEGERFVAMEDLLRRVAGERTVVLWLDDAQLDGDAARFARRLLRTADPLPALVVLTVEDEALADRPEVAAQLAELVAESLVEVLPVGPLGEQDHQELVRGLLGLEGSVALRVEQTTAGNPLFAVQLVGDWIARGLLTPSERGFRLTDPDAPLPTDLLAVWEQRVAQLLATRSVDDARALELGAVLGLELRQVEFRRACRLAGIVPGLDLVDVLMSRGLARPVDDGGRWGFVHGMVREVLVRQARDGGRWPDHNRACAAWLRANPGADPERLAAHLVAAGQLAEALEPLQSAIASRLAAGDVRSSSLISELERALGELARPPEDPTWGELWLSWAWLFRLRGELQEAERWAVRCERAARRHGWRSLLARALRTGARIERNLGHLDQATEMIDEAEAIFQAEGDRSRAAACRVLRGDVWWQRSDVGKAAAAFRSALGATEDPVDEVEAWMGLARCAQRSKDIPAFTEALDHARDAAERAGSRRALAAIANYQGELARESGDLELAETFYLESTRRHRALDDANHVYSELNVGLLQVQRGAWEEARARIEPLRQREERGGVETIAGCFARAVLLPCCAGLGDWSAFKDHYKWLKTYLAGRKVFDKDLARMAALAAELSMKGGRPDGAQAALQLAIAQYQGLGMAAEAKKASDDLDRLRA